MEMLERKNLSYEKHYYSFETNYALENPTTRYFWLEELLNK
jgi:hypothetical protein